MILNTGYILITFIGVTYELFSALFLFCTVLLLLGTVYLKLTHFGLDAPLAELHLLEMAA